MKIQKSKEIKKFGKYFSGKYRVGVFVVVYRLERGRIKYLLLKRKKHWRGWEFPKGGLEKNEPEFAAATREVFEETGLSFKQLVRHNKEGRYFYSRKFFDRQRFIGQTYALYSAELSKGKVLIDKKEHSGYVWLRYKYARARLSKKNQRECLNFVHNYLISSLKKIPKSIVN